MCRNKNRITFICNAWTWLKINTTEFKSRSGMLKLVADQFLIRIQFCNTFDMKKKKFRNLKISIQLFLIICFA